MAITKEWERSFEALYKECTTPQPNGSRGNDYLAAATLRVQIFTGRILLEGVLQERDADVSTTHNRCLEVLDLSKQIAEDPDFIQTFAFGHSVVPSVFFMLMAKVDDLVERKALELLKNLAERKGPTAGRGKKAADKVGDWYWATKYLNHWKQAEGIGD